MPTRRAISAATKRASACSSSTSTTSTGSPCPSSEKSRFGLRSRLFSITGVGRLEDGVRGAVVLLERDHLGAGEVALEVEDVANVRAAEAVDGLVRVPDGEHVAVLLGQQLQQPVLRVVRVLVLVDEHVAERLLPLVTRLREALQHLHREHEQVVEVDGIGAMQRALVEVVHLGHRLVPEGADAAQVLLGCHQRVLRVGDLRVDAPGCEPLRVLAELLEAVLHDTHLVGLVVDRERRLVAEPLRLAAQHAAARGVEGEDPDRARRRSEHALQPLAHLAGRLVGERDREDLVRLHAHGADQVRDTMRQHARLARARARDHEHGPFGGDDGLTLGGLSPASSSSCGVTVTVRC